ncbi:unnamed protein product [Calypogeia fissa]
MAEASGGFNGELSDTIMRGKVSDYQGLGMPEVDFEDMEIMYIDELAACEDVDVDNIDIYLVFDEVSREEMSMDVLSTIADSTMLAPDLDDEPNPPPECIKLSMPGFRVLPDEALVEASRGEEKSPSERSDKWAMKRANFLRKGLGWDMSTELGDLPLK